MERVRFAADFMPRSQMVAMMEQELGPDWRGKFHEFEYQPTAAASIGQVHRARLLDGSWVAVKVQYPGVAESVDSDLNTLGKLLVMSRLLPKGLYLDRTIDVARKELAWETDYLREAEATERFRALLEHSSEFLVPRIYRNLSTSKVLVMDWMQGIPLDRCVTLPSSIRDKVNEAGEIRMSYFDLDRWRTHTKSI
jgi:aarF domain-containing kinase